MSSVNDSESVTALAVSVKRAAAMLGVSDRHLWKEIKAKRMRTKLMGTRILVPVEAIREYLKPDSEPVPAMKREKTDD